MFTEETLRKDIAGACVEAATGAYHESLSRLKLDPTNSDLKQEALRLGRTSAHFSRDATGVTVFDELSLMNDINAACAGTPPIATTRTMSRQPIEERLAQLADLHAKGLITAQDYASKRDDILREL